MPCPPARKFVEPQGGRVVAEYFDIDQSRSVPWDRRDQGSRLLAALKDRNRGWNAAVVGEGTRCWFGNQFTLIAPRFAAYGVDLWVPELGGKCDGLRASHKMPMSVLGGMSESERQHVQSRVRAAMDAQVANEGRHQGGLTPYGYLVVDGGPHPNPHKAAEGHRPRILVIEEETAEVVRRDARARPVGARTAERNSAVLAAGARSLRCLHSEDARGQDPAGLLLPVSGADVGAGIRCAG